MSSNPIAVLSIGRTMLEADDLLTGRFDVVDGRAAPLDEILARDGERIRAVMTRGGEKVPGDLIERLPRLEIIANLGVGYDKVDVRAAEKARVIVTNTPGVLTDEVADFTVGLLLSTIREIPQSDAYVRSGGWSEKPFRLTASLRDRTIGIVGMGQIGAAIANRLAPFGRPIAYHARRKVEGSPYRHYPTALDLADAVDTLIVIVPGGPATDKLIDARALSALGPNGIVINVARGSVVDETALVRALEAREIAGAGLDVFEREPHPSPELLRLDNVVLCSHVGSGTVHTRGRMAALGAENITSWFDGRGPVTPVPETPWPRST